MYKQEILRENLNNGYTKECIGEKAYQNTNMRYQIYERLCGFLTLEMLFTMDSVLVCAERCACGFWNKEDTQVFMRRKQLNAKRLAEKVRSGKFRPKYYSKRQIKERGKIRTIKPPTYECKIVQKVLCDYLIRPLLEPKMTPHCYASVKGRGTSKMYEDIVSDINTLIKKEEDFSVITFDYRGFFASILIGKLMEKLSTYIRDDRIIALINQFSPEEFGLSLGNELSQIPASWYPSEIDHYFESLPDTKQYRYMDDSLLIVRKGTEQNVIRKYQSISDDLKLSCPDEKIHIYQKGQSFIFCKERFQYNRRGYLDRYMNEKIPGREAHKLYSFKALKSQGKITDEAIRIQSSSAIGSIRKHPNTGNAVKHLVRLENAALDASA